MSTAGGRLFDDEPTVSEEQRRRRQLMFIPRSVSLHQSSGMIPILSRQPNIRSNIKWKEKECSSVESAANDDNEQTSRRACLYESGEQERAGGRFPHTTGGGLTKAAVAAAKIAADDLLQLPGGFVHDRQQYVEVVELNSENTDEAVNDLLGLRVSGSRSVGVFVCSVQAGSASDANGRIKIGDQLLQVESICLIGLTPDQVVRVLRGAFSYNTSTVRLVVLHQHSEHSSCVGSTPIAALPASRSEGSLSGVLNLASTKRDATSANANGRQLLTLPGACAATTDEATAAANAAAASGTSSETKSQTSRRHKSVTSSTATINDSKLELELDENRPTSVASSDGADAIDDKYPTTSLSATVNKLKLDQGDSATSAVDGETRNTALRHRKLSRDNAVGAATATTAIVAPLPSKHRPLVEAKRFSPKSRRIRGSESDDSLQLPRVDEEEDRFHIGKSPRSHTDDIKHFISTAQRKSIRSKDTTTNDELPLVSFDQLSRTSPSPTDSKRTIESGSSGRSKSSKDSGSRSSQGSQQLSWQCPICLDGASRLRRSKRRMMSTACGHVFCSKCVSDVIGKYHMCPTCRSTINSMNEVHPIFM